MLVVTQNLIIIQIQKILNTLFLYILIPEVSTKFMHILLKQYFLQIQLQ